MAVHGKWKAIDVAPSNDILVGHRNKEWIADLDVAPHVSTGVWQRRCFEECEIFALASYLIERSLIALDMLAAIGTTFSSDDNSTRYALAKAIERSVAIASGAVYAIVAMMPSHTGASRVCDSHRLTVRSPLPTSVPN